MFEEFNYDKLSTTCNDVLFAPQRRKKDVKQSKIRFEFSKVWLFAIVIEEED